MLALNKESTVYYFTLVYIQEGSHTMPRPVGIVQTHLPQGGPRKGV